MWEALHRPGACPCSLGAVVWSGTAAGGDLPDEAAQPPTPCPCLCVVDTGVSDKFAISQNDRGESWRSVFASLKCCDVRTLFINKPHFLVDSGNQVPMLRPTSARFHSYFLKTAGVSPCPP